MAEVEPGSDCSSNTDTDQVDRAVRRRRATLATAGLGVAAAGVLAARTGDSTSVVRVDSPLVQLSSDRRVELEVIFRDFLDSHPDFEPQYPRPDWKVAQKGLVKEDLGPDGKPVWNGCPAHPCAIPSRSDFDQWYTTGHWNREVKMTLSVDEKSDEPGVFSLWRPNFFPLNGLGFNDQHMWINNNYYFTMEARHTFVYHGGEWFRFRGDDDLWVFFNSRLGLDIGGVHAQVEETVYLDDHKHRLGLEEGQTMLLNIFFAERAFSSSNFMIETNIILSEDPCVEYDRVQLRESPTTNALPGAISWTGENLQAHEMDGNAATFSFRCVGGQHCHTHQIGSKGGFPAVSVNAWASMPLTLDLTDSRGAAIELAEHHITFYGLERGMAVEARGVTGYTRMADSYIFYHKSGDDDLFQSQAPLGGSPPDHPSDLTEEQKRRSLTLVFSSLENAQITLRNRRSDSQTGVFMFTLTPMFQCIPCWPPCPGSEPLAATKTTTTTTTEQAIELGGGSGSGGSSSAGGPAPYRCCAFDHVGVEVACYPEKQWWLPWCPDSPGFQWPWQSWELPRPWKDWR